MHPQACTRVGIITLLLVAIGCGGPKQDATAAPPEAAAQPAAATAAAGSATVSGTVTFKGTVPAPTKVKMDADPVCQLQHPQGMEATEVVVSDGRLANVLVYVKDGLAGQAFPTPTTPVVLDQQGCWYVPHVLGVQVNQPLEIRNSDGTLHNVNVKPSQNPPFNIAQPAQGMKTVKKFTKAELGIKAKCNVHPWMSAYLGVFDHPFFAVSGQDGTFAIANLPAGTYTIEAWHEKFGAKTQSVTVGDGEAQTVSFEFP